VGQDLLVGGRPRGSDCCEQRALEPACWSEGGGGDREGCRGQQQASAEALVSCDQQGRCAGPSLPASCTLVCYTQHTLGVQSHDPHEFRTTGLGVAAPCTLHTPLCLPPNPLPVSPPWWSLPCPTLLC
jgi:hypothetical protein